MGDAKTGKFSWIAHPTDKEFLFALLGFLPGSGLLVASDLGRNVYAKLGYLPILRYTLWLGFR